MHIQRGVTVIWPNECRAPWQAGRPPLCWASTACEGTSCLGSMPTSPVPLPSLANAPGAGEKKTRSLAAWRCSANCAVGRALMIIFCISQIRPHSRWDAAAVTRSGNWAAVQKRSGLCALDHLRGGIAAGTLGAGQGGARQQASLPRFVDMLDGVWGCLDLREAGAVVES